MELELHSDLIYKNNLDTDKFARMLNDPSQCYKFYWLEAIVNLITITEEDLTFDQIINEMIWEAWHSVTRYHLHLGPTIKGKSENFLEHAIGIVEKDPLLKQPASKNDVFPCSIPRLAFIPVLKRFFWYTFPVIDNNSFHLIFLE